MSRTLDQTQRLGAAETYPIPDRRQILRPAAARDGSFAGASRLSSGPPYRCPYDVYWLNCR
jgi:hypothetical protein